VLRPSSAPPRAAEATGGRGTVRIWWDHLSAHPMAPTCPSMPWLPPPPIHHSPTLPRPGSTHSGKKKVQSPGKEWRVVERAAIALLLVGAPVS
jgi:hypothetical protein